MTWQISFDSTAKGAPIRYGFWPAKETSRSTCLLLPGLGDFLEKRAPLAEALSDEGHDVLSLDWRGQGGSGRLGRHRKAAHIDDFSIYLDDIIRLTTFFSMTSRPMWILAYSMGCVVALQGLNRQKLAPEALVLISPMLKLRLPVPEILASLLSRAAVTLGYGQSFGAGEERRTSAMGTMTSEASEDTQRLWLKELLTDQPDMSMSGTTWGWGLAALKAMPEARRTEWRKGPSLIITASQEQTVDLSPVMSLERRLGARRQTVDGAHDLFLSSAATQRSLMALILETANAGLGIESKT